MKKQLTNEELFTISGGHHSENGNMAEASTDVVQIVLPKHFSMPVPPNSNNGLHSESSSLNSVEENFHNAGDSMAGASMSGASMAGASGDVVKIVFPADFNNTNSADLHNNFSTINTCAGNTLDVD